MNTVQMFKSDTRTSFNYDPCWNDWNVDVVDVGANCDAVAQARSILAANLATPHLK